MYILENAGTVSGTPLTGFEIAGNPHQKRTQPTTLGNSIPHTWKRLQRRDKARSITAAILLIAVEAGLDGPNLCFGR